MTKWTSAKIARFIREILDEQPDLEARANFRVHTGVIVKHRSEEYNIIIEPKE
jgi:hypothetical protein